MMRGHMRFGFFVEVSGQVLRLVQKPQFEVSALQGGVLGVDETVLRFREGHGQGRVVLGAGIVGADRPQTRPRTGPDFAGSAAAGWVGCGPVAPLGDSVWEAGGTGPNLTSKAAHLGRERQAGCCKFDTLARRGRASGVTLR